MEEIILDILVAFLAYLAVKSLLTKFFSKTKKTKDLRSEYKEILNNPKYKVSEKII